MTEYKEVNIADIFVTGDNPRKSFDEEKLRELGSSMFEDGQLQEIWLRRRGDKFELVTGERRYRAAKLVGITKLRARIEDVDDSRLMEIRLLENTQREDLTEAEKGNAIGQLLTDFPDKYPTIETLANKLKKSETTVNRWVQKSERLSNELKKFTASGRLSDRVAYDLVKFDHATQNKLAKAIINYTIPQQKKGVELRREFIKRYALNPKKYPTVESLEDLANEVKGIKKVKIDLDKLSPEARAEVERKLKEAKDEAKKLRKKPKKKRNNRRRQGRPKKKKQKEETEPEKEKSIPEPTIPIDAKTVTIALSFPEPLWEQINRYMTKTNEPTLLEDVIISLLETHPSLRGL